MHQVGREPAQKRATSGKDRSKDPLMPRSLSSEPYINRDSEIELVIMTPDTQYQPADNNARQQAMEQWHRTGW